MEPSAESRGGRSLQEESDEMVVCCKPGASPRVRARAGPRLVGKGEGGGGGAGLVW